GADQYGRSYRFGPDQGTAAALRKLRRHLAPHGARCLGRAAGAVGATGRPMRVIIAGGGTGGHLFPAVAVGEELKRERPQTEVMHVGASNGIEAKWFPPSGLRYELFEVRGWTGK